jgi:outer membrane biosynthesis protein TonB
MKKVFIISMGGLADKFMVAADQEEAFERRAEVDQSYEYLPVQVKELEIEGFEIQAKPKKEEIPEELPPEQPEIPEQPEVPQDKPPEKPKSKNQSSKKPKK